MGNQTTTARSSRRSQKRTSSTSSGSLSNLSMTKRRTLFNSLEQLIQAYSQSNRDNTIGNLRVTKFQSWAQDWAGISGQQAAGVGRKQPGRQTTTARQKAMTAGASS